MKKLLEGHIVQTGEVEERLRALVQLGDLVAFHRDWMARPDAPQGTAAEGVVLLLFQIDLAQ